MDKELERTITSPKVSVLTPIYNTHIEHLREAIDSILAQTFTDFEYLILNDSPDNTSLDKLVNSYDDPRIIYLKNGKNVGLEESTNRLIKKARGEYIAIFDHDDISMPDRLEKEAGYLDANPNVGVVSGQFEVFGIRSWVSENPIDNDAIKLKLATNSCVSHTTIMYRKSVVEENKIKYEKRFFPAASYRLITRLALVTDIHNLPDILLKYRMDGENTSIKHSDKRIIAREKLRKDYEEGVKVVNLKKRFNFDSVTMLEQNRHLDERRYFTAQKGDDKFFIKSSAHDYSNEFRISKLMFEKDKKHFVEPVDFYSGETNYLVMKWGEGVTLDKYLSQKSVTKRDKDILIQDLVMVSDALWDEGIVHRDLTPRNLLVVNGSLLLIDLYFAVKFDDYQEYEYIANEMLTIGWLGEDFAAGVFKWDDAYSFTKIAKYIYNNVKNGVLDKKIKKITDRIGKRVITPDPAVLFKNLSNEQQISIKRHELIMRQQEQINQQQTIIAECEKIIAYNESLIKAKDVEIRAIKRSRTHRIGRVIATPLKLSTSLRRKKNMVK